MNKHHNFTTGLIIILLFLQPKLFAQSSTNSFSLEQAIVYALEHNEQIQTAALEKEIANRKVGEILADGMPQISGSLDLGYNYKKPTVPFQDFVTPATYQILNNEGLLNAPVPEGEVQDITFVTDYTGSAGLSLNQMIFDGSFFVGLEAARTFTELSRKTHIKTKIDVAEAVSKAYYAVLISQEMQSLVGKNYTRIESLLSDTKALYEGGFAEKIDVSRVQVQFNNLKVEKDHIDKSVELSLAMLKFQMGMPSSTSFELSDDIASINYENIQPDVFSNFAYSNRIEYSQLETQKQLNLLDIKNTNVQYIPKIDLYATLGGGSNANSFSDLLSFSSPNWFGVGVVGVRMNVPIFDGFRKSRQIQQKKLKAEQIDLSFSQLKNSIDVELRQATINYNKNRDNMLAQQKNMNLAQEVYDVSQIKYKEGVGSNSEVLDADAALKQSQTNYYNALYEALIAKIDLQKALGTLLN